MTPSPGGPRLFGPEMLANPYPFYHRLRAFDPVHWSDQASGATVPKEGVAAASATVERGREAGEGGPP